MTVTGNPSIMIYVNKIQNRITFKIRTRYHLELSITETKKYLKALKVKSLKKKNLKNLPHLEVTEIVLIVIVVNCNIVNICNIVNNNYRQGSGVLYIFFLINY